MEGFAVKLTDNQFYALLIFGVFVALLFAGYNLETIVHTVRPLLILLGL